MKHSTRRLTQFMRIFQLWETWGQFLKLGCTFLLETCPVFIKSAVSPAFQCHSLDWIEVEVSSFWWSRRKLVVDLTSAIQESSRSNESFSLHVHSKEERSGRERDKYTRAWSDHKIFQMLVCGWKVRAKWLTRKNQFRNMNCELGNRRSCPYPWGVRVAKHPISYIVRRIFLFSTC